MDKTKEILIALKKAQTHLGNVIQMIEEKEYCIAVLQQNMAVIGLLRSANGKLFERHLNSCFVDAMKGTNEKRKRKMINEILSLNKISQ